MSTLYPPRRFLFIQPLQSLLDLDRGDDSGDDDEDADGDDNGDVNLLSGALSVHPEPDCVDGNTDHRRARHDVAERMSPPDLEHPHHHHNVPDQADITAMASL